MEHIGVIEEYRARDQKHYETYGVVALAGEKTSEDLRTENEKENKLSDIWCALDEAEKKFSEQEQLHREGKIDFYNTAFNIVRDNLFFKTAREQKLLS